MKVARLTSSVLMTSADSGDAEVYVADGLSLASRKRACQEERGRGRNGTGGGEGQA